MLFDSDWRDWLSQWDANGATTGNRPTGFPNRPTTTEATAGTPAGGAPAPSIPPTADATPSPTGPAAPVPPAAPSTPVENPITIFTPPNAIPSAVNLSTTPDTPSAPSTPGTAGAPNPRYASTTAGPLLSLDDALAAIPASTTAPTKSSKGSQNPQSRKAPNTRKEPQAPKKQQEPKIPATRSGTPEHIKKRLIYAGALLTPTLILALGLGLGLTHSHTTKGTQAAPTTTTAAPSTTQWCIPQSANPYISNAGGTIITPEGLLATMEQQYFGTRSAPGVMALISGDWVDTQTVTSTIDSLPQQPLEWCTTIRPAEPGWYTVIVDWRPKGDEHHNKTWVGDYHVQNLPGVGLRITGMRPNLKVVEELRKKEEAKKAAEKAAKEAAAQAANEKAGKKPGTQPNGTPPPNGTLPHGVPAPQPTPPPARN